MVGQGKGGKGVGKVGGKRHARKSTKASIEGITKSSIKKKVRLQRGLPDHRAALRGVEAANAFIARPPRRTPASLADHCPYGGEGFWTKSKSRETDWGSHSNPRESCPRAQRSPFARVLRA